MSYPAHSHLKSCKRLIIKIGSALLCDIQKGTVKQSWIKALSDDIHTIIQDKKQVIIVSSGGIALGRKAIGIPTTKAPASIPLELKQAASAVGQPFMYDAYAKALGDVGYQTAQILLTLSETENRRSHLNARETLYTLAQRGIIPVINENDTVSTEEIRFGDNDRLAVRVAQMIEADTVLLFSTTDGFYSANPETNAKAEHFPLIEKITSAHRDMAGEALAGLSTGGMRSKVQAAESALQSGISLIIADGRKDGSLGSLLSNPDQKSTLFKAADNPVNARKRWLQGHLKPKGMLTIDAGAVTALKAGKSLLPVGIVKVTGVFERGDPVSIFCPDNAQIGMGLSAYSSEDAKKLAGKPSSEISTILGYLGREEFIHRNDMILLT